MKTEKEIEEGCGNWFDKIFATCLQHRWMCGREYTNYGLLLCPTCQALLQQSKEFIEMVDKWWKRIDIIHDAIKDNNKLVTPEELEQFKSLIIKNKEKTEVYNKDFCGDGED